MFGRGSAQVERYKFGGSEAPQRIKDPHSKIEDLRMKVEDRRSKTVPRDLTRPWAAQAWPGEFEICVPRGVGGPPFSQNVALGTRFGFCLV